MSYVVLARKWRPGVFDEVVGQGHVTTTLTKAIDADRIAHAYLFAGPRGVGKTTTARILAKALNCHKGLSPVPCNKCDSCKEISEGRSIDVLEIDGASNRGIDEIRQLRANVKFATARDRFKIYIIDEVHMLTTEAFNALLKTLEEPPEHVKFIFATTVSHKIPPTIISRCQKFDFRRISIEDITGRLGQVIDAEGVKAAEDAVFAIAREAGGSMRDAESVLDQLISFSEGEIRLEDVNALLGLIEQEVFFSLSGSVAAGDAVSALKVVENIVNEGKDIEQFVKSWQGYWRDILMVKMGATELVEFPEDVIKKMEEEAGHFSEEEIFKIIGVLTETLQLVRGSTTAKIPLEIAAVELTGIKGSSEPETGKAEREEKKAEPEEPAGGISSGGSVRVKKETYGNPGGNPGNPGGKKSSMRKKPVAEKAVNPSPSQARGTSTLSAVGSGLTLDEVREKWHLILENVKKEKLVTSAFLMEGVPVSVNEGEIAVGFNEEVSFHMDSCNMSGNKKLIEKVIEKVFHSKLRLNCVDDPSPRKKEEKSTEPGDERKKKDKKEEKDPVAKKTMEIFGVNIIDVKGEGN